MKIGFEIHQQLDTRKLFSKSPSLIRDDEAHFEVTRRLRPTQSELGLVDEAAMKEFLKGRYYVYKGYNDTISLVELDEEPPRGPDKEAVEAVITIALLLNATIVDEIHFMRKLVIDGSNTSGFQRTAIIAYDGYLDTEEGRIAIPTICLEEEAARKISDDQNSVTYNLDRLGIPLVEITTAPDIKSPKQARDAALKVGEILRATRLVKRGLGTIRQDINVSTKGGARVEIKGVQDLNIIPGLIENEIERQKGLIRIREELKKRGADKKISEDYVDLSEIFRDTQSKVIRTQLKKGVVLGMRLPGYAGLLGGGLLGREMARYVRVQTGVRGIFHSDELPAYGVSEEEVAAVRKGLKMDERDAFVLVAERHDKAKTALKIVLSRAMLAIKGPLEETRMARDGLSEYMRPLPGSARMYPETDILPFVVSGDLITRLAQNLPETYEEMEERVAREYGLGKELSRQLVRSPAVLEVLEKKLPTLGHLSAIGAASIGMDWSRDIEMGLISPSVLEHFLDAVDKRQISKEASKELKERVLKGETMERILGDLGGSAPDIEGIVDQIISSKKDFILEKGLQAQKPLMGLVMKEARGRIDGKRVNEILKQKIMEMLSK